MQKFTCIQYGICPKASTGEEIEIKPGAVFQCPRGDAQCRENLVEIKDGGMSRGAKRVLILAPVGLVVVGLAVWFLLGSSKESQGSNSAATGAASVEELLTEVWPWLGNK